MSAEPLTHDGAWFVGIKADGSLDRDWPANAKGRTGTAIVMGESAKIIKVVPVATARALIQDVEAKLADCMRRERAAVERAEALRGSLLDAVTGLAQALNAVSEGDREEAIARYDRVATALAADDEARAT